MAKRRPVSNPLALAVLAFMFARPMYPYELATMLRETGKDQVIKINWGSLYTVVQNLEKHGLIKVAGTTRQGGRPERTAYELTDAGLAEMRDWLRELLSEPQREYPLFATALSLIGPLAPEEFVEMLEERLITLKQGIASLEAELTKAREQVPRMFLIESEYLLAIRKAEDAYVTDLLADLSGPMKDEVEAWRKFQQTGELPADLEELLARSTGAQKEADQD